MNSMIDRPVWSVYYPLIRVWRNGKEAVEKAVRGGSLISFALIATPSTQGQLVVPVQAPEYSDGVKKNIIKKNKQVMYVTGIYFMLGLLATIVTNIPPMLYLSILSFIGMSFIVALVEHIQYSKDDCRIVRKSVFYSLSIIESRKILWLVASLFVSIGLVQWAISIWWSGGFEGLVISYGAYFDKINEGEMWRLIGGPFFHSGVAHWLTNLVVSLVVIALTYPHMGYRVLGFGAFLSTLSYVCVFLVWKYHSTSYDALVGLSGGIAGISGWLLTQSFVRRKMFPAGFSVGFSVFIVVTFFMFSYIGKTSFYCHLFGFLMGCIAVFIVPSGRNSELKAVFVNPIHGENHQSLGSGLGVAGQRPNQMAADHPGTGGPQAGNGRIRREAD